MNVKELIAFLQTVPQTAKVNMMYDMGHISPVLSAIYDPSVNAVDLDESE